MKAITKIKIKIFITKLLFEIVVNSCILAIAYLSGKFFETLLFYIPWQIFRLCVPKIFHIRASSPIRSIFGCLFASIFSFMIAMRLMLPIQISIFSSVLVGVGINYCFYKIQDYIDLKAQAEKKTIDIYRMTEEDLRTYARSKHLSEMMIDTLVLRVIHNYKWSEIMEERNYSKTAIRYHKDRINKILQVNI